jgi:hypothetical protein
MMEAMPRVDHGEEALASDNGLLLRNVELTDVDAYVRMRCDPAMMTELGGPLPREGIEDKVARDAAEGAAGSSLIKMIVPGGAAPGVVAGSVVMWQHDEGDGARLSEIGWMVLPEFQGRGIAKRQSARCFSWRATPTAGDWCTRSRPPPTAAPTASAAPSASGWPARKTSRLPAV